MKMEFSGGYRHFSLARPFRTRDVSQLYDDELPVSRKKYLDLTRLCTKQVIPPVHKPFYTNLKVSVGKSHHLLAILLLNNNNEEVIDYFLLFSYCR